MGVVVRCPRCRGAAQVGPEAVDQLVACPRCGDPFLAIEEVMPVARAGPGRKAGPKPSPRNPTIALPVAAAGRPRAGQPDTLDPGHADPEPLLPLHRDGLPVSVLIGLALLPFAIPLLWLIVPLVVAQPPALSPAAPVALAVAAAVLCLAVVYTVDWSPATRVKGVLILVGLAYFTGLSLYFLKKDMVDRAKEVFGTGWHELHPQDGAYTVQVPGKPPEPDPTEVPLPGWKLTCYKMSHKDFIGDSTVFVVGAGPDVKADDRADDDQWFKDVGRAIGAAANGGEVKPKGEVKDKGYPGQEWTIKHPGGDKTRTVRVYRAGGKIFYLAVEKDRSQEDDEMARKFFDSFYIPLPKK